MCMFHRNAVAFSALFLAHGYSGALEPQFFAALLKGLSLTPTSLPGPREDRMTWPALAELFTRIFKSKTRREWEDIFDSTDACCLPVLTQEELKQHGFKQRPIVGLTGTPGLAISRGQDLTMAQGDGVEGEGWTEKGLSPGAGGEQILQEWLGWRRGKDFNLERGGLVVVAKAKM